LIEATEVSSANCRYVAILKRSPYLIGARKMMASISSKYGTQAAIGGGDCFRLSEDLEGMKDKWNFTSLTIHQLDKMLREEKEYL
jgi:hypothetical protein